MINFDDTVLADKAETLERLRHEVACLAINLEGIPNQPEEKFFKIRLSPADPAEIFMSFSHEPVEAQD
jgi:hypothetical protein